LIKKFLSYNDSQMKKCALFSMLAFFSYTSSSVAMHPSPRRASSNQLNLISTTITDLHHFFQNHDFGVIKKLKISHPKIDPELFKSSPPDLKELSLKSVKDLKVNIPQSINS